MNIEYYPWSKAVLKEALHVHKHGMIPTLDIELTSKCSGASCIYCDSKPDVCAKGQLGEMDFVAIRKLVQDARKYGLKWVYTCGLGEPLEDNKFWNIVHLLKENNITLSMFTNGIFIKDIYMARELKKHNVNIILKMDTFKEDKFDIILGKKGIAQKIYASRDNLLAAGYQAKNEHTNLAFSIVPTSLSIDGIPEVIAYCKKNGIYASIGELEQAGEVIKNNLNNTLSITKKDIINLKKMADEYIEGIYMRPICPCILTGIHIDNFGNCIVDSETGLNCKWFLLKDPQSVKLGSINTENVFKLFNKANTYRKNCFSSNVDRIKLSCAVSYAFGGCGGNPKDIIELACQMV